MQCGPQTRAEEPESYIHPDVRVLDKRIDEADRRRDRQDVAAELVDTLDGVSEEFAQQDFGCDKDGQPEQSPPAGQRQDVECRVERPPNGGTWACHRYLSCRPTILPMVLVQTLAQSGYVRLQSADHFGNTAFSAASLMRARSLSEMGTSFIFAGVP